MARILLILCFLLSSAVNAQTPKFNYKEKEQAIRKIIASRPDSAKVLVRQVLDQKGLHDTIYADAYIYYGFCHLLKADLDSALYFYDKAETFTGHYPSFYARVLRNKASIYRKKADYDYSLKLLSRAREKYEELGDSYGLASVYAEIGSNYNQMLKGTEAIPYLLKAIEILEKKKNINNLISVKQSLANTYMNIGNFEFAIELYKEVLQGFKSAGQTKNYYMTLINYGDCYIHIKKYDMAGPILLEAIAGLQKFNDTELVAAAYSRLGRMNAETEKYAPAKKYYKEAIKIAAADNSIMLLDITGNYLKLLLATKEYKEALDIIAFTDSHSAKEKANLRDKLVYEQAKASINSASENDEVALASLKNYVALHDTFEKVTKVDEVIRLQGEYQNKYQQKKYTKLKKANSVLQESVWDNRKRWFVKLIPFLLLLAAIIVLYFYLSRRNRKKIALAKADVQQMEEQYEQKKETNKTLREQEENLVANTPSMDTMQDSVNRMIAMFNTHTRTSETPSIDAIKKGLENLVSDKDYWEVFRKNFSLSHADFIKKLSLRFPQLTEKELFFCSLHKVSLPNKDLAIILQVAPETVKKTKYRLKKKLEDATGEDFDFIINSVYTQDMPGIAGETL